MPCLQAQLTIFLNTTPVNNSSLPPRHQKSLFSAPEALTVERMSLRVKVAQELGYNAAHTSLESMHSITSPLPGTYRDFEGWRHSVIWWHPPRSGTHHHSQLQSQFCVPWPSIRAVPSHSAVQRWALPAQQGTLSLLFLCLQHPLSCKPSVSKRILHECEGQGNI